MTTMDVARGASAVESVYVIGSNAVGLPPELNFAANNLYFENRYGSTQMLSQIALNQFDTNQINFLFNTINQYMRMRTYTLGEQFNIAPLNFAAEKFGGQLALTPLVGMGITYWDQLYVTLGSSQQPLAPTITNAHNLHMQRWLGYVNKTDIETRKWWEMAGFVDYKTMEWIGGWGGVLTNKCAQTVQNPTLNYADANCFFVGSQKLYTPTWNGLFMAPYGITSDNANKALAEGVALIDQPVREQEAGLWIDNEIQRMRSIFYGSVACSTTNYLTKIGLITDAFETPLTIPGLQMSISLRFNEPNSVRPRYVNTPVTDLNATATAAVQVFGNIDTTAYAGITPNANKFWLYMENIIFRSDIHAAFLFVWVAGKGLTDHMNQYDLYQQSRIYNVSQETFTIIQQGNNVPWMSSISFEIQQYPNPGAPINNQSVAPKIPPYMYPDVGLSYMRAQITTPNVINFESYLWQSSPRPDSMAPFALKTATNRGVVDQYYWWKQMGYETQYFYETNIEDINSKSLRDFWGYNNQPGCGSVIGAVPAGAVIYGAFQVQYPNNCTMGMGYHNNFWRGIWAAQGFADNAVDFGVFVGSLRYEMNWLFAVPTYIRMNNLSLYQTAVTYLGSGQVATNIRFK